MKELNRTISVLVITAFLLSGIGPAVVSATPISESSVGSTDAVDVIYLDTSSDQPQAMAPSWPTTWILIDDDPNETQGGLVQDFRDVIHAYCQFDSQYLYLRLQTVNPPAFQSGPKVARYKWFIDLSVGNPLSLSGQIMEGSEYLLFVENSDDDAGSTGEVYLLNAGDDEAYDEYEPSGYLTPPGPITNSDIADYRFGPGGNYVDLYVRLSNIGGPQLGDINLTWATDQENPNLDQGPELDTSDSLPISLVGSITITKDAVPDDPQDFNFSGDLDTFTLDDDGGTDTTYSNSQTFPDLTPGTYDVTETVPSGWSLSITGAPSTDNTANITLNPGDDITVTFTNTNTQDCSISGYKWADCNENTTWDEDEVGLIGWEINLYNKEDTQWVPHSSNVTGPDGAYTFTRLAPGQYKVEEALQSGWIQTYPSTTTHEFTLQGGESKADVNFGNHSTGGSICANKVVDFSQGTKQGGDAITDPNRVDPNEALGPPDSMDKSLPTFFTLGYGGWIILEFAHAITGSITVYETTWGGPHGPETVNVYGTDEYTGNTTTWTLIGEATNNNGYNNGTGYGVNTHPTTLTFTTRVKYVKIVDTTATGTNSGDAFDIDAVCGEYACGCTISGHKYLCDSSDNCTQEGLPGWTITLDGPSGTTDNTTDSDGYYEFTTLSGVTYTISETMQDDWINCTPTSYEITIDEDCGVHGTGVVVSDTHTQVTDGNAGTHPHHAVYAWEHPAWTGINHDFSTYGADWIWESYRVVHPIAGDIVEFQRNFYIPGTPTDNCTLYITCDNGYEVYLNSTFIGSAQVQGDWETSNRTQSFVDTTNWQSVESYTIPDTYLQQGTNILVIKAANEYMGPADNPTQNNGTIDSNPAGLIYELSYEFDATEIDFCNRQVIPNITIIKTADPTAIMSGEQVTYTYQVTNTGDVDLTNITVNDDQLGNITNLVDNGNGDTILSPGETWVYQATANPTDDVTNTGTACGIAWQDDSELEQKVCNSDNATVEVLKPQVSISGHKYRCDVSDNCTTNGLEGWTITLQDQDGTVLQTKDTDSEGYYEFTGLPDGTYTVSEELKPGWENCTPRFYDITLCNGQQVVVSDNNTMVTIGNGATPHPAVYAWEHLDWATTKSTFSCGADWIWESDQVIHPVLGDKVEFQRSFDIPGTPTGGTLYITCDNGYEVKLNGATIGSNDDWKTVESYNVSLKSGTNILEITATNLQTPGGTPSSNPGGLIYELFYDSDVNFCNRQLGTITIVKEVIGDAPESDWEFTSDNITDFSIAAPGGSHTSDNLTPGTYTITETTKTGYAPSVNCTDCDNCTTDGDSVTIDLGPGDNVTCTFTNTKLGTIIVEKQTVPDGASDNFTFTGDVTGTISDGQQLQVSDLLPGQYTITETVPAAWDLTDIAITEDKTSNSTSSNTTATIKLDPGESVTVTFTNTKKETSILVEKVASPTTAAVGGTITYTYTVTNTGEVTTDNITLVDDMLGIILLEKTTLAPGESTQSTGGPYTYTVTAGDLGSPITNVATATGTYPVDNQVSDNATASVTISSGGGRVGGGGGGYTPPSACPLTLTVSVRGTETMVSMTLDGVLCEDCMALGPQGQIIWAADAGTKLTLANNEVPRLIKLGFASSPPPPSNAAVVGPMYELNAYSSLYSSTPYPITISPLCNLVLPYDPDELPDNTSATLIAYYDEELGKWIDLETAGYVAGGVEVPNSLTSQVNHFTTFAVLAKLAEAAPAKFSTSNLTINPTQAQLNQEVTISITVTNSGSTAGDYNVRLTIDDVITAAKQITLAPETSQPVSFTINADAAGKHQVEVAGLTGDFEILGQSSTGFNWWLIGGVLILVLLSVLWLSLMRRRLSS